LNGNELPGETPAGREPAGAGAASGPARSSDDDRAPVFGRWGWWYLLVVLDLALVVVLCGWLTRTHR